MDYLDAGSIPAISTNRPQGRLRRKLIIKDKYIATTKDFRINQEIRAPKVTVIDDQTENLGIMDTFKAIELAKERELDLVEVSPNLNPPVCKIMDYGKHRYKVSKQTRQHNAKQKKVETKSIRVSVRTEGHDLEFKASNVVKFMIKGHRVKVEMVLKGREKANTDFAKEKFEKFATSISDIAKNDPKSAGKEIVKIQEIKQSPQGFSTIIEFKRS